MIPANVLRDLSRAKATFQLATVEQILRAQPINPSASPSVPSAGERAPPSTFPQDGGAEIPGEV